VSDDWYMYVVECADGTYYTGITTDLARRVKEHNESKRGAKYTRSRRPVNLIFSDNYYDRSTASKAEYRFKSLTRRQKEIYIEQPRTSVDCSLSEG